MRDGAGDEVITWALCTGGREREEGGVKKGRGGEGRSRWLGWERGGEGERRGRDEGRGDGE